MCNNQEKQKRPCEQEKKPKLLTDTEANQASGGVYVPDTSSFVMSGGVINEGQQEGGGVYVPDTSSLVMSGGAINEGRQESNGVVGTGLIM